MSGSGVPAVHPAVAAAAMQAAAAASSQIASPIPTRSQLDAYNVNRQGWEGITNSIYDSAPYAAAGQPQLSFFNQPVGQGVGVGGGTKTLTDTNMTLAGQMPANQEFLIQSVEVIFYPAVPTVIAAMPAAYGAGAIATSVNDSWLFHRSGNLTLTIGAKAYLQEAPLGKFPGKAYFQVNGAASDASTAAATQATRIAYGQSHGRPYMLKAALRLVSNQNFGVTLNWPEGNVQITNPARVYVILDGVFYRRSQ